MTTAYNREQLWLANETLITKLQARCRGYLVRKGLRERMEYLKSNEPAATNIQVRRNPGMKTRGGRRVLTRAASLCAGSLEGLQAEENVPRQEAVSERPRRRRGQGNVRQSSPPVFCRNVLSRPPVTSCPLSLSDPVHGPNASGSQEVQGSTQVFQRSCEFQGRFRGVTSSY